MKAAPAVAAANRWALAAAGALVALTLIIPGPAQAIDYRSIAPAAAVLYDAPSAKARKIFILNRGYPVEVLFTVDTWLKVREASGELAWIEAKNLSTNRMVIVKVARAEVRRSPEENAPVLFYIEQNGLLEFLQVTANWVQVKHRDGTVGYIRITQVWGV